MVGYFYSVYTRIRIGKKRNTLFSKIIAEFDRVFSDTDSKLKTPSSDFAIALSSSCRLHCT